MIIRSLISFKLLSIIFNNILLKSLLIILSNSTTSIMKDI